MINPLNYLIWVVGRLLYPIRDHDDHLLINTAAFKAFRHPTMILFNESGPTGSKLHIHNTGMVRNGVLPIFEWCPPSKTHPKEYLLICEDIDHPIPFTTSIRGLFWGIPGNIRKISPLSISLFPAPWMSDVSFCVPDLQGGPYVGPNPLYGHGAHRCVFTIVALSAPINFPDPVNVTRRDIKKALVGKVLGWGQWVGKVKKSLC